PRRPCSGALDPRDRLAECARPTTGPLSDGPALPRTLALRHRLAARGLLRTRRRTLRTPAIRVPRPVRPGPGGSGPRRPLGLHAEAPRVRRRYGWSGTAKAHGEIARRAACTRVDEVGDEEGGWRRLVLVGGALVMAASPAWPRSAGDPVRVVWDEGDVAGVASIYGPDGGEQIGLVEYRQTRRGDLLRCVRVARFRDGTRDEDEATARVSGTLEAVAGRSIIRDRDGEATVEVTIDVAGVPVQGPWGRGPDRHTLDRRVALPRGTY